MLIRVETPIDMLGIADLLRACFQTDIEQQLAHSLREQGLITLGLVAADEHGQVVGYLAMSPVTVEGQDPMWVGLAPLAVAEKHRRQGLGKRMIREALNDLNELGYQAVVVLGDPDYYTPLGFRRAADFQLRCKWPHTESAFLIYPLGDQTLHGATGLVDYSAPFNQHF